MKITKQQIISLVLLAGAVIYDFVPLDFIPDIPIVGWLDDFFLTSSAAINCLQQFNVDVNGPLYKTMQVLKWVCIVLAILIVITIIALAGTIWHITR